MNAGRVMKSDAGAHRMPPEVAEAFEGFPPEVRGVLRDVRALIFRVAEDTCAGPLTETLKWGEPAYLTQASKSGTTIRLGRLRGPDRPAVLFNCRTTLIAGFREQFGAEFDFDGNRALVLKAGAEVPEDALAICLARALTYHRDKRKGVE